MSDETQRWKEKYLKSIEQQEKLERRWDARLDLLRRGLVRSTLAAEGTDRAVDQCMKEMREVVRSDDMDAGLAALLPRLEKAVLDSEQRRETRVNQTSAALTALVTQLQKLPLPREVRRPLKNFAKQLDSRVSQAREIPLLLSELSGLQGKALSQLDSPTEPDRPGLLQRLFGHRETEEAAVALEQAPIAPSAEAVSAPAAATPSVPVDLAPAVDEPPKALPVSPEAVSTPPAIETSSQTTESSAVHAVVPPAPEPRQKPDSPIEMTAPPASEAPREAESSSVVPVAQTELGTNPDELTPVVFLDTLPLPTPMAQALAAIDPEQSEDDVLYALPDSPEPSYSSVAKHIEDTLLGLLDDLTLPERHRPQAESMRDRLKNGLNWYELLPILDDLATLMLAISDSGQHEFETYLQRLNERLESFQSNLQAASDGHADSRSAAQAMDTQIREQVDGLQNSMHEAADLDDLKQVLENQLEGLLGTMDQHRKQRDEREQEVAGRLKSLAERVALMEQEALGFREHLEEQRQKALIDPLTGLPNRAAWSERLDHEISEWQQHGNTLMLAMLDLDHFKRINDNYGHLAGDKVLKLIASVLRKRLRGTDFIARFGGEEFVLLMPSTVPAAGMKLLEYLRASIEACPFHFKGERVTITISMGLTAFKPGEHSDLVLKRADQALYRAKNAGRNRVELG
ncbi:diguanylate cyclase [Pseudomonas mohnii]|uniref:diguanylate cyclase n=1 Tax=Pseudomonas mohnii TaxID=395600 RepID=A0ABY0Y0R9_9PSED|nr:diguanylate cyclase [Pseudomonas mohnii]SEC70481.1 diguanylate cyclase [Pseudomonas mohnii]